MRRLPAVLAVAAVVLLPGAPAWAHNQLVEAAPAADSTLTAAPKTVRLVFLRPLKPGFTTVVVATTARRRIPAAEPAVAEDTATLTLDQDLANDTYTVAYRSVSVDGHVVQGAYVFTVADPARPAAAAGLARAAATPARDDGIGRPVLLGLAGLGVGLTVLAAALFRKGRHARRRSPTTTDRAS